MRQPKSPRVNLAAQLSTEGSNLRIGIVACCALASFAIYYPGKLSPDSAAQLQEAVSGHFTDWHPPIMAALWRLLTNVASGPAPMLALQVGLYWIGIWAIWDAVARKPGNRAFLPLLAAIHPLILVSLASIQKDVGLAACLTAAFGIMFRQHQLNRRATVAGATVIGLLLVYAALVRWNGMLAVATLLLFWLRPTSLRPVTVIGATALLTAAFIPIASFIDHGLLRASRTHAEAGLQLYDLAGIEHFSGDNRLLGAPAGCYTPFFWDPLASPTCGNLFDQSTRAGAQPIAGRWIKAIAAHPLAYALHRLEHFNSSTYFIVPPAHRCVAAPEYFSCDQPKAKLILDDFVKKNFLYWPCIWLAAGAWLLARGRASPAIRALAWSGMIYGLGYLFVGIATDWRYYLWTEFAIAMALALHFAIDKDADRGLEELVIAVLPIALIGYAARLLFVLG
jgi:hypothetical protein